MIVSYTSINAGIGIWLYAQKEKEKFEVNNQVISEFVNDLNVNHMSRIGILYSESL